MVPSQIEKFLGQVKEENEISEDEMSSTKLVFQEAENPATNSNTENEPWKNENFQFSKTPEDSKIKIL